MLYICETKDFDMTTITINKRTKAGKLIFEMAKLLSEKEKGVVSAEQKEFGEFVKSQLFCFEVCYSWFEAVAVLKQYLN